MKKKYLFIKRRWIACMLVVCMVLVSCASKAWSLSFLTFDARSIAMGGTGVVTARSHNASLFNPALLIAKDPHRQTQLHLHSYVGARLLDRDNFRQAAENFGDRYKEKSLEELLTKTITLAPERFNSGRDLRNAATVIRQLQADINFLSDKPLRASASYGFAFSYPVKRWALGGYHRQFLVMGSKINVANVDNEAITRVASMVEGFADLIDEAAALAEEDWTSLEDLTLAEAIERVSGVVKAALELDLYIDFARIQQDVEQDRYHNKKIADYLREPLPKEFFTTVDSRGAEVTEQAVSAARSFEPENLPGHIQLGLNFKHVEFTTLSFSQRVTDFDLNVYQESDYRREYQTMNVDVGGVYNPPGALQFGVVVRNLVPYNFFTVNDERVEMRPVARIGVGYVTRRLRLSTDLDLTKNEPLGFDPDKQYVSMGIEWLPWRNTALRAGIRTNIVDGETLPAVGFGIGTYGSHVDFALAKSANGDEWGVGVQIGLAF